MSSFKAFKGIHVPSLDGDDLPINELNIALGETESDEKVGRAVEYLTDLIFDLGATRKILYDRAKEKFLEDYSFDVNDVKIQDIERAERSMEGAPSIRRQLELDIRHYPYEMKLNFQTVRRALFALEYYFLRFRSDCKQDPSAITPERRAELAESIRRLNPYMTHADYNRIICTFRALGYNALDGRNHQSIVRFLSPDPASAQGFASGAQGEVTGFVFRPPEYTSNERVLVKTQRKPLEIFEDGLFGLETHEVFVSVFGIGRVYRLYCPPVFGLSFGGAMCRKGMISENPDDWCPSGYGMVNIQERYESLNFEEYITELYVPQGSSMFSRFTVQEKLVQILAIVLLVADGLNTAYKRVSFVHNDLHLGNILITKLGQDQRAANIFVTDRKVAVRTTVVPKIIDYGFSSVEIDGITFSGAWMYVTSVWNDMLTMLYTLLAVLTFATRNRPHELVLEATSSTPAFHIIDRLTECFLPTEARLHRDDAVRQNLFHPTPIDHIQYFPFAHDIESIDVPLEKLKRAYTDAVAALRKMQPESILLPS